MRPRRLLPLVLVLAAACGGLEAAMDDRADRAGDAPAAAAPAPRDDRDRALDSALAAFREGLPVVERLADGERSRDALVRRFLTALERADTTDLRAMMVTRAEFAWLYYPGSAYTRRPSRQEADLAWFLHLQDSQKGVSRALARYGTRPMTLVGYECDGTPVVEGENRLWGDCVLRLVDGATTARIRLFGSILERDGVFKVHSFRNDL